MIQSKKEAKWRSLVSEREASGQSIAAFSRARELRESLFYHWKRRLKQAATPPFVEVQVGKPAQRSRHSPSAPDQRLRYGSVMVGALWSREFDAGHLRALLAVVES